MFQVQDFTLKCLILKLPKLDTETTFSGKIPKLLLTRAFKQTPAVFLQPSLNHLNTDTCPLPGQFVVMISDRRLPFQTGFCTLLVYIQVYFKHQTNTDIISKIGTSCFGTKYILLFVQWKAQGVLPMDLHLLFNSKPHVQSCKS